MSRDHSTDLLTAEASREPRVRRVQVGDTSFAWLMMTPALLLVGGVLLFPLGFSLWTALNSVDNSNLAMHFIGLRNFRDAVSDPLFTSALRNTLYFAVATIAGTMTLGLAIALVLNEDFRGRTFLRTLIIVPWAVSQIVVGVIWAWIYNGTFGILNAVLKSVGLIDAYQGWLSNPRLSMGLVAIAFVWSSTPFAVIMYLAALQTIPTDLYKAARVDGAGAFRAFWHITLPALRYTSLVILMVASLDGLLAFSLLFVMTGGGPGTATTVLSWLGYQKTFQSLQLGEGAAIFYILVGLMVVVAAVYIKLLHRPSEAELRR